MKFRLNKRSSSIHLQKKKNCGRLCHRSSKYRVNKRSFLVHLEKEALTVSVMSASNDDGRSFAWNPKSPATLTVPFFTENGSDGVGGDQKGLKEAYIASDGGIGCNTFESSAIMNLLDARDAYLDEMKSITNNSLQHYQAILQLSKEYRKAVAKCISEWSKDLEKDGEEPEIEGQQQKDRFELCLLRESYAIMHLSEIFIILPRSPENRDGMNNSIGYRDENLSNLSGAMTADTVRYLRKHHFQDIEDLFDQSFLEKMWTLKQPDQYDGDENNTYWGLVEAYMVRGCLEEAYAVLSHHSIVQRFWDLEEEEEQMSEYHDAVRKQDYEGFQALHNILLSAPLPGSRNSDLDDGFGECEYEDNDEESKQNERKNDGSADEEELIHGVPSSAYCLWERSGGKGNSREGNFCDPDRAYQIHQYWNRTIQELPSLLHLRRRLPELNRLLNLLVGDFRDIEFGSWQEELCAELLYKNPCIPLVDIHVRANALAEKYGKDGKDMIDEVVLTIMRGNHGEVVKALFQLGGGSGAALPAVMVRL